LQFNGPQKTNKFAWLFVNNSQKPSRAQNAKKAAANVKFAAQENTSHV